MTPDDHLLLHILAAVGFIAFCLMLRFYIPAGDDR